MNVFVVMLMGGKPEPFLAACLDSLYGAVDRIVLNDNSGLPQHANLSVVQQSRLYQAGKIEILPSSFIGFGPCRELCLVRIRELAVAGDWIIFVDCDEVHPPQLPTITRSILPYLPAKVGIVDGYFYQFFQFPRFITSLDHRHNLMFRYNPEISWQGQVHGWINECQHASVPMDFDGDVFESGRQYLMCPYHGAIYQPGTGLCVGGPCRGARLDAVDVVEKDGAIWLQAPAG